MSRPSDTLRTGGGQSLCLLAAFALPSLLTGCYRMAKSSPPTPIGNPHFRWVDGKCRNGNEFGQNPNYFGECGILHSHIRRDPAMQSVHAPGLQATYTHFSSIRVIDSDFRHSDWSMASLVDSSVEHSDWDRAELKGITILNSSLARSHFAAANLAGSQITLANFRFADLRDSNLQGTKWTHVNLSGGDLRGADLRGSIFMLCDLKGARFNDRTVLPFSAPEAVARGMIHVP